jgi:hypothetical protein
MAANFVHQAPQMAAYLAPRRGLARPQQHGDRAGGGGVIDMDWQKATLVVMRVEHRQLLMYRSLYFT